MKDLPENSSRGIAEQLRRYFGQAKALPSPAPSAQPARAGFAGSARRLPPCGAGCNLSGYSPRMNASVISRATLSLNCLGGVFMK